MTSVLYAIPASHPCAAVEAALRLKGLEYRRVDMPPFASRLVQWRRFGRSTVPGVAFHDGERVVGSRAIMRELDRRAPEPRLLPPEDDEARPAVERAEAWGDEVLQPLVRRAISAALRRAPDCLTTYVEGARLPLPTPVVRRAAPLVARTAQAVNHAGDLNVRADLIHLGTHLARVEGWLEEGTLSGAAPNAADLQIAASLRLLLTIEDVATRLGDRPAVVLAHRCFPAFPGRVPAGTLPSAWLKHI